MDIQQFFYWTASIVLILFSALLIALFSLIFYLKKLADRTALHVVMQADSIKEGLSSAGRTWRNLAITRFVIRALRTIF